MIIGDPFKTMRGRSMENDAVLDDLVAAHRRLEASAPVMLEIAAGVDDLGPYGSAELPEALLELRSQVESPIGYYVDSFTAALRTVVGAYTLNPIGAVAMGSEAAMALTGVVMTVRSALMRIDGDGGDL